MTVGLLHTGVEKQSKKDNRHQAAEYITKRP